MVEREMTTELGDDVLIVANVPFAVTGDYGDTLLKLSENSANLTEACAVFSKEDLQSFITLLTERYNEIV